jgi:hypothetical protein
MLKTCSRTSEDRVFCFAMDDPDISRKTESLH